MTKTARHRYMITNYHGMHVTPAVFVVDKTWENHVKIDFSFHLTSFWDRRVGVGRGGGEEDRG